VWAVNAGDGAVAAVGGPHRAAARRERVGRVPDRVLSEDVPVDGVDDAGRVLRDPVEPVRAAQLRDSHHDRRGDRGDRGGDDEQRHGAPPRAGCDQPTGRAVELRVLAQDRVVEAPQLGARLEPHLVEQDPTGMPERLQRVRLPAAAVQGEHPLAVQPLAQRVLADQVVDVDDHRLVVPGGERDIDLGLARPQPQILQPPDLGRGERLVGEIIQRRPPPQRERLAHVRAVLARGQEALEPQRIDRIRVHTQLIAAPARDDLRARAGKLLAQLRDEHLHGLVRGRGRPLPPQPFDQAVGGDRGVGIEGQDREQRAWLGAPERDGLTIVGGLDEAEKADLHDDRLVEHLEPIQVSGWSRTEPDSGGWCRLHPPKPIGICVVSRRCGGGVRGGCGS
jgi:hypothetical protein